MCFKFWSTYSTKPSPGVVDLGIITGALSLTIQTTTTKYRTDQNGSTVISIGGVADSAVDVTYSTKPNPETVYLRIGVGTFTITNSITWQYDTTQNIGSIVTVIGVGGVADSAVDIIYSTKPDNKLLGMGSITRLNTTTTITTNVNELNLNIEKFNKTTILQDQV